MRLQLTKKKKKKIIIFMNSGKCWLFDFSNYIANDNNSNNDNN